MFMLVVHPRRQVRLGAVRGKEEFVEKTCPAETGSSLYELVQRARVWVRLMHQLGSKMPIITIMQSGKQYVASPTHACAGAG